MSPKKNTQEELDALVNKIKDEKTLGDLVHDLKSDEATDINNDGVDAQVRYIVGVLGIVEAIREIEDCI